MTSPFGDSRLNIMSGTSGASGGESPDNKGRNSQDQIAESGTSQNYTPSGYGNRSGNKGYRKGYNSHGYNPNSGQRVSSANRYSANRYENIGNNNSQSHMQNGNMRNGNQRNLNYDSGTPETINNPYSNPQNYAGNMANPQYAANVYDQHSFEGHQTTQQDMSIQNSGVNDAGYGGYNAGYGNYGGYANHANGYTNGAYGKNTAHVSPDLDPNLPEAGAGLNADAQEFVPAGVPTQASNLKTNANNANVNNANSNLPANSGQWSNLSSVHPSANPSPTDNSSLMMANAVGLTMSNSAGSAGLTMMNSNDANSISGVANSNGNIMNNSNSGGAVQISPMMMSPENSGYPEGATPMSTPPSLFVPRHPPLYPQSSRPAFKGGENGGNNASGNKRLKSNVSGSKTQGSTSSSNESVGMIPQGIPEGTAGIHGASFSSSAVYTQDAHYHSPAESEGSEGGHFADPRTGNSSGNTSGSSARSSARSSANSLKDNSSSSASSSDGVIDENGSADPVRIPENNEDEDNPERHYSTGNEEEMNSSQNGSNKNVSSKNAAKGVNAAVIQGQNGNGGSTQTATNNALDNGLDEMNSSAGDGNNAGSMYDLTVDYSPSCSEDDVYTHNGSKTKKYRSGARYRHGATPSNAGHSNPGNNSQTSSRRNNRNQNNQNQNQNNVNSSGFVSQSTHQSGLMLDQSQSLQRSNLGVSPAPPVLPAYATHPAALNPNAAAQYGGYTQTTNSGSSSCGEKKRHKNRSRHHQLAEHGGGSSFHGTVGGNIGGNNGDCGNSGANENSNTIVKNVTNPYEEDEYNNDANGNYDDSYYTQHSESPFQLSRSQRAGRDKLLKGFDWMQKNICLDVLLDKSDHVSISIIRGCQTAHWYADKGALYSFGGMVRSNWTPSFVRSFLESNVVEVERRRKDKSNPQSEVMLDIKRIKLFDFEIIEFWENRTLQSSLPLFMVGTMMGMLYVSFIYVYLPLIAAGTGVAMIGNAVAGAGAGTAVATGAAASGAAGTLTGAGVKLVGGKIVSAGSAYGAGATASSQQLALVTGAGGSGGWAYQSAVGLGNIFTTAGTISYNALSNFLHFFGAGVAKAASPITNTAVGQAAITTGAAVGSKITPVISATGNGIVSVGSAVGGGIASAGQAVGNGVAGVGHMFGLGGGSSALTVYTPAQQFANTSNWLFHVLYLMIGVSYYRGVSMDPGRIPDDWKDLPKNIDMIERKQSNNDYRYCQKEGLYKPDRSHFCKPTGRNVLRMDHYCPWLSNC